MFVKCRFGAKFGRTEWSSRQAKRSDSKWNFLRVLQFDEINLRNSF